MSDDLSFPIPKWKAKRLVEAARPRPMVSDPPPSPEEMDRRIALWKAKAAMERTVLAAQPPALTARPKP